MDTIIRPGARTGTVTPPASKSQAHRQLICAALSGYDCEIFCDGISKDIEATIHCLNSLGAEITTERGTISISPIKKPAEAALWKEECGSSQAGKDEAGHLLCAESGSTLRFLIPVAGALGKSVVFHMEGKLPERPLGPFAEQLTAHGMTLEKEGALLHCYGQLTPGSYTIPGNISSQFISGLLFALPLLKEDSRLTVTGKIESEDYIRMTEQAVKAAGIIFEKSIEEDLVYQIPGGQMYSFPPKMQTERDWSGATFFLCMGALSEQGITVNGLSLDSAQGDKAVLDLLSAFGAKVMLSDGPDGSSITVRKEKLKGIEIDASRIPDMVPALSAVAATAFGQTRITHAERLRMKESDRLQTVTDMLAALGADIRQTEDGLVINGKESLSGGVADAAGDHRIAMAAAVAACSCTGEVTVTGSQCVSKSYPGFWEELETFSL